MKTRYIKVDRKNPDKTVLVEAARILASGGLVAFPTETVYGLGANGLDAGAVAGIYQAKGRPSDNPLILHIHDAASVLHLARTIPANARALMEKFWPGPLTIIFERQGIVPDAVTGGLNTVAVRLPASPIARELIRMSGVPVAAPSANVSGRPSPTTAEAVLADLNGKIDVVIDGGPCAIGVESTVIDCTTPVPTLLRPGGITLEMLMETLGAVDIDPALEAAHIIPRSPGMKYTHYAPASPLVLFEGEPEAIVCALREKVFAALAEGKRVGAIVSSETAQSLPAEVETAHYGSRGKAVAIAANLYNALLHFDQAKVDIIFGEGIPEEGIGLAVMNRLRKAAGYNIVKV